MNKMPAKVQTYIQVKKWGSALFLGCALVIGFAPMPKADQTGIDAVVIHDPVQDTFDALRRAALALEDNEAGQALEGLVRAMLARGKIDDAIEETGRINDNIWYARAMVSISQYLIHTMGRTDAVPLSYLARGLKRIDPKNTDKRADETRHIIALNNAFMGNLDHAQFATEQITDQMFRINTLQLSASAYQESMGFDKNSMAASAKILKQAYLEATKLKTKDQSLIDLLISIGQAQAHAGDIQGAQATYHYAYDRAVSGNNLGRFSSYAKLASALIYAGDNSLAMQILRKIGEGGDRAIALSIVAKSMAGIDKEEEALPLFTLAFEQAQQEKDLERRYAIYAQILEDQTSVGRLADAFTTAGAIKDRYTQSLALLRMGENLIKQGKYADAYTLVDYIPYIGMRAQIFADTAVFKSIDENDDSKSSDPLKVSAYLMQALEDTGFDPSLDHLSVAIHKVLETQLEFGDPEMDIGLFERAKQLAYLLPTPSEQIDALTYLAAAMAQKEMFDEANKTVSSAWRIAWQNKYEPIYAGVLAKMTQSQIAVQDILSALDTAARIPLVDGPDLMSRAPDGSFRAPRFDALASVAAAAAQMGETEIAIRAARQIRNPQAHAAALAAVAIAVVSPDKPLREIVGIGPTGISPYDILTVQFSNTDDNEEPSEKPLELEETSKEPPEKSNNIPTNLSAANN